MTRMFTTCPACRMNLAVTAADLRVGQGYVRCGRCDKVFNALLSLAEDLAPAEQSGLAARGTASLPALDEEEAGEELAFAHEEEPPDFGPDEVEVVDSAATGTYETIVLEGDTIMQTEELVDAGQLDAELRAFRQIQQQLSAGEDEPEDELLDAGAALGTPPRRHWAWGVAAGLLAVLLAAQVAHRYRQSLVASPLLERPLTFLYGLFGVRLEPAWDLAAYDLRQLGGEAPSADASVVVLRATVHNRAPNRQPLPMIRAVLQDRFGNALSTTAVEPQEYLRGEAPARMAPDQRLDIELRLPDPARQAVGFELDACLPAADGRLYCSGDP